MDSSSAAQWVQDGLIFISVFSVITISILAGAWKIGSSWISSLQQEMKDGFTAVHKRIDASNKKLEDHDKASRDVIETVHRNDERLSGHLDNGHRHKE